MEKNWQSARIKPFSFLLKVIAASLLIFSVIALLGAGSKWLFGEKIPGFAAVLPGSSLEAAAEEGAEKRVIILDAGHGGMDSGAVSVLGTREKEINLAVAKKVEEFLRMEGMEVVMTRSDDRMLTSRAGRGTAKMQDLLGRVEIAREYENGIFVSIHMNTLPMEKYKGLQVFYSANSDTSKVLALTIQSHIAEHLQPDNKRETKKAGSNIFVLDRLEQPAVLIECGFLSNYEEASLLIKEEYQNKLAFLIAHSILQFAGND